MSSDNLPPSHPHSTPETNPQPPKPRRRWRFQYSLRTLLIFVSIVGVLCGYLGMFIQRVQKQRAAVNKILQLGGQIHYDYEYGHHDGPPTPPGPACISRMFGDDLFANVIYVSFYSQSTRVKDEDLAVLRQLPKIVNLDLHGPGITDEGMKVVADLSNLQHLSLCDTKITPQGLSLLTGNNKFTSIFFDGITVNDNTLAKIGDLDTLEHLMLRNTSVTDAGLAQLPHLKNLKRFVINLNNANTGKSLEYISKLFNLECLWLGNGPGVTNGFEQLKDLRKLKELSIRYIPFNDKSMELLNNFEELIKLDLAGTAITDEGLKQLIALKKLCVLDLSSTKISKDSLLHLKCLTSLQHLTLGPGFNKSDIEAIGIKGPCVVHLISKTGVIDYYEIKEERVGECEPFGYTCSPREP